MPMTTRRKRGQKQKKERNIFMTKPGDLQTKKTIHELSKEFPEKTYRELEKYRDADRQQEAQQIITQQENEELKADQGKEIDYHRYWKKRAEEAEGELSILKGIGNTSPEMRDAKAQITELQSNLDRIKKENNDLYNRIADLTDPDVKLKKARESGL
jgi:chromosome segregation ATPase